LQLHIRVPHQSSWLQGGTSNPSNAD
jgi:hypothetical protein